MNDMTLFQDLDGSILIDAAMRYGAGVAPDAKAVLVKPGHMARPYGMILDAASGALRKASGREVMREITSAACQRRFHELRQRRAARRREVRTLHERGLMAAQIGVDLGVPYATVLDDLRALELVPNRSKELTGACAKVAAQGAATRATLIRMIDDGCTADEIVAALGLTRHWVLLTARTLGKTIMRPPADSRPHKTRDAAAARRKEMIALQAQGLRPKEIKARLSISQSTYENMLRAIRNEAAQVAP